MDWYRGPVSWSPDLKPLNYFLWGSMKSMVYGTPVTSEEDLIGRVHGAIEILQDNCTYWVMCVKLSIANVGGSAMT